MNNLTPERLVQFFELLAQRYEQSANLYIFGGSALLLIGSRRNTGDIDFTINTVDDNLRQAIAQTASELGLDVEESVPAEFMPLPRGSEQRHMLIGTFGKLKVFVFDLYSIAIMKIDRAFETDVEDVRYLLNNNHINLPALEEYVDDVASRYDEPLNLRRSLAEMKRGL